MSCHVTFMCQGHANNCDWETYDWPYNSGLNSAGWVTIGAFSWLLDCAWIQVENSVTGITGSSAGQVTPVPPWLMAYTSSCLRGSRRTFRAPAAQPALTLGTGPKGKVDWVTPWANLSELMVALQSCCWIAAPSWYTLSWPLYGRLAAMQQQGVMYQQRCCWALSLVITSSYCSLCSFSGVAGTLVLGVSVYLKCCCALAAAALAGGCSRTAGPSHGFQLVVPVTQMILMALLLRT